MFILQLSGIWSKAQRKLLIPSWNKTGFWISLNGKKCVEWFARKNTLTKLLRFSMIKRRGRRANALKSKSRMISFNSRIALTWIRKRMKSWFRLLGIGFYRFWRFLWNNKIVSIFKRESIGNNLRMGNYKGRQFGNWFK